MDKRKSLINISIGIGFKFIILFLALYSKSVLIDQLGNEVNGLFSLYTNILGVLSVSELGFGVAIAYCMYKPISENDTQKINALYILLKKIYLIVGLIIFILGICLTPFLHVFAGGYSGEFNLYSSFLLMLTSVCITYLFSCDSTLISGYKNNYINTLIVSIGQIVMYIFQIIFLFKVKSFELFMMFRIVSVLIQWILTKLYCKVRYKDILSQHNKLDIETKIEVKQNVKAMVWHSVGGKLVNSTDSIIISTFISVSILGIYSNYLTLMTSMITVISIVFSQITSIIGHAFIKENRKLFFQQFEKLYLINFIIALVFFLGYYAIIDNIIVIIFKKNLVLDSLAVKLLTINYFIQFLRTVVLTYRDATGCYKYDKYKAILEGIVNITLDLIFVHFFGIYGVLLATIITNIFICNIVEPYILYKHVFEKKAYRYYIKNYFLILVFVSILFCFDYIVAFSLENPILDLLAKGSISVFISSVITLIILVVNKNLRLSFINNLRKIFKRK